MLPVLKFSEVVPKIVNLDAVLTRYPVIEFRSHRELAEYCNKIYVDGNGVNSVLVPIPLGEYGDEMYYAVYVVTTVRESPPSTQLHAIAVIKSRVGKGD